ncbi:hypothetical protein A2954_06060 [Candidatus Roizmanbacteria bacterium RIFCSPLOWO2_01_FULL_37_12]|uniref:Divalent-cation tolerance protein CutA n=1 Tax=Candidatus Roizmanbacteria bacterium RIFCSPLOWO2_01_FULL_37_12 TaxID=1802056 RepID=A0A1F7ICI5_9BACT|nr:MAG: hypothetical protein A2768_01220 [Candidatus Roizmanbacteria bacterium RIFCSPHIGHO2_01_FULL_37_16]OGK26039.1 MAG: hypothetical protein A3D76_00295 [Candidatus Roizmanbacteria bacterium RIFCSPHIGHO2_02_FULL_37_9b]OGK41068.1 MAG: hypothetical protein A2954_06060 [Candidatus Roizmanbacteria bacterium RIFCSPLOWO2_01_FULL_37_12]
MKIIILFLTCANLEEAEKISQALLKKKLVVCIKKTNVLSSFLWEGKLDKSEEVLLIMDSIEEKFAEIEKEVRKIHSYETFVLVANPVINSSKGVKEWIKKEIKLNYFD